MVIPIPSADVLRSEFGYDQNTGCAEGSYGKAGAGMNGFNEVGILPRPDRHLTKEEMDEKKKTTGKTEGEWIREWYLNQPMDSDPQSIRAHMWMLE